MTMVRRCDNPACANGPGGTVNVSNDPNPDWLTVTVGPVVGNDSQPADACSGDCAVALVQQQPSVQQTLTIGIPSRDVP